jgi:hypothetical protein
MPDRPHGRNRPRPIPAQRAPLEPSREEPFQAGASDDPTANHDERCTLASHAITVTR